MSAHRLRASPQATAFPGSQQRLVWGDRRCPQQAEAHSLGSVFGLAAKQLPQASDQCEHADNREWRDDRVPRGPIQPLFETASAWRGCAWRGNRWRQCLLLPCGGLGPLALDLCVHAVSQGVEPSVGFSLVVTVHVEGAGDPV